VTSGAYVLLCTVVGLVAGWLPVLLHGPIPQKLDAARLNGALAIWTYYGARLLIGFMVGTGVWPATWWMRGPLYGILLMLPPGFLALGTPGCGPRCMALNLSSGAVIGLVVAGVARLASGRSHA
jgi:hypothetical protein